MTQTARQKIITGTKSAILTTRLLKTDWLEIKQKLPKHKIKSFQQIFDYLVSSGVCYLKPEIISFVRQYSQKYKEIIHEKYVLQAEEMRKGEIKTTRDYSSFKELKLTMYQNEFAAFANFCLEQDIKKQWVINALFLDGFKDENPIIIDFIKKCQKEDIVAKKRKVASQAVNDIIKSFDEDEAKRFLTEFTKGYDNGLFDEFVHTKIVELMKKEGKPRKEIEKEFEKMSQEFREKKSNNIFKYVDGEDK